MYLDTLTRFFILNQVKTFQASVPKRFLFLVVNTSFCMFLYIKTIRRYCVCSIFIVWCQYVYAYDVCKLSSFTFIVPENKLVGDFRIAIYYLRQL